MATTAVRTGAGVRAPGGGPEAPDAGPTLPTRAVPGRPRRRSHHRLRGLSTLVVVEALIGIALVVWVCAGRMPGMVALGVAVLVSLLVLPLIGGRSVAGRCARRVGFLVARSRRRSADLTPSPFDIPGGSAVSRHRPSAPTASRAEPVVGARWADGTLITVLRLYPRTPAISFLTPQGARMSDATGQTVPLDVLAECISSFDIPLTSVDVVSHGLRSAYTGVAAASYQATLGPLPATAQRTVLVILRLDPTDCPDAVARRGGGAVGALRTATIATRRVERRLTEHGLSVSILSAAEITAATTQLTEGVDLDDLSETRGELAAGGLHLRSATIEPDSLEQTLTDVWVSEAFSTTTTVRLSHAPDGELGVRGLVRFNRTSGTDPLTDGHRTGLRAATGRQFDALTASLPVATTPWSLRDVPALTGQAAAHTLPRIMLPVAGCGQLVGADHTGRAVAVRLAGPGVGRVAILGEHHLAAQIALRAVATGATVRVHTDHPGPWRSLLSSVGDPRVLAFAGDRPPARFGHRVELFDGVLPHSPEPDATHIVVRGAGDQARRDVTTGAVVVLTQNPRSPQDISMSTPHEHTSVTLVATPDEWRLIGGRPEPGPVRAAPTSSPTPPTPGTPPLTGSPAAASAGGRHIAPAAPTHR